MTINRRDFLRSVGSVSLALGVRPDKRMPAAESPVQFWDMDWGGDTYKNAASKLVAQYNGSGKSKAAYEFVEWTSWPEIFFLALGAGQPLDVSTGGGYQAVQYYSRNQILPLDDVVEELTATGEREDFLPGSLERVLYEGHTVGLPWSVDVRPLYYRKDLFAKAGVSEPTTWDELEAAATALSQKGQSGFVLAGAYLNAMQFVITLMLNNGGGLFSPDGKLDMMYPRNVEAMQFFSRLVAAGLFNPKTADFSLDDAHAAFLGNGGAIFFGPMGLQHEFPDQAEKIGVLPPPAGPHGDKAAMSWVESIMLYRQSANPDAAKKFLKWWSVNQKPLWTEGHCRPLPVRASLARDPYFRSDPIMRRLLDEWLPVGKSGGFRVPGIFPALNELEGYGPLASLCRDILGGRDVIEAMKLTLTRLKDVLASYGIKTV
jgi:multiple sugar transport system substrate-binding protein